MSRKLSFLFWKIHFHFFSNNPSSLKSEITLLCSCRNQTIVYTFNVLLIIVLPSIVTQCHCLIIFFLNLVLCIYVFIYILRNEYYFILIIFLFVRFKNLFLWIKIIEKVENNYIFLLFLPLKRMFFRKYKKLIKTEFENWIKSFENSLEIWTNIFGHAFDSLFPFLVESQFQNYHMIYMYC